MASFGHIAVGLAASRFVETRRPWPWLVGFSALSLLPDADVVAFVFRVPYGAPFGHRGATHSLAFAAACGLVAWLASRDRRVGGLAALVVASHPLLDMLTDGGLGCALWWPVSNERLFWPITPLPVAPIGAGLLSARGALVLATEVLVFSPLLFFTWWKRRSAE